jgi:t-SNARE complex subunit (syntaxin)
VNNKYIDILALEKSFEELNEMFFDFAFMIDRQGVMLDQIEHQVNQAIEHVDVSNVYLEDAVGKQIQWRKKQCMLLLIVIIIVLIVSSVLVSKLA